MSLFKLVIRSLGYYWRANLGTLLAIMVSGTILTGALVVGDSVEYSLGRVVTNRLGGIEFALTGQDRFFTTELAEELGGELDATAAAVLQLRGLVSNSGGTIRIFFLSF